MDDQKPTNDQKSTGGITFDLNAIFSFIEDKKFHQMVISYQPKERFRIYIDGEEIKIKDTQFFRVWNRALTAEEVAALYENKEANGG